MLILSRKVGEQIVIGQNIVVSVQKVGGNRVSLAIDAPREIHIMRSELPPHDYADLVSAERCVPAAAYAGGGSEYRGESETPR